MRLAIIGATLALLLGALPVPGAPASGGSALARGPHVTTPEEALDSDLRAIAKANGWTLDQARANHRSEQALDAVIQQLVETMPGVLVGSALSEDPEGPPTIYLKGPTNADIEAIVAAAGVPILIVDNEPFNADELDARAIRAQEALLALGIAFASTHSEPGTGGRIESTIARTAGFTPDELTAIIAALPEDLRPSVALTVVDPPIDALLCQPVSPAPSPQPSTVAPSPSPTQSPGGLPPKGSPQPCVSVPAGWGPLAVVDDPAIGGLDAAIGPGRLSIGPRCVTLRGEDGSRTTLVWRAGDTRWDPKAREILFVDRNLGLWRLSSGDRVILGGFSPASPEEVANQEGPGLAPWITEPDDACPARLWEVNGLDFPQ
jgi:hypothetical protein